MSGLAPISDLAHMSDWSENEELSMKDKTRISFEYFPPRDESQLERFHRCFTTLASLEPVYASITWGALGSDSQASLDLLASLANISRVPLTAHLSCIGQTHAQLRVTLDRLEALGIRRILALRGDQKLASEIDDHDHDDYMLRHASDLVSLIAEERPHIDVSVAAYPEVHPESESATVDLHWLKYKLDCGAARAITQFFFEADSYLRFRDCAQSIGIDKPLIPGILPVHDIGGVQRFAAKCGACVPAAMARRFEAVRDEESRQALGIEECLRLCRRLEREGVRDFHLYTLNRPALSRAVASELTGSLNVAAA